MFPVSPRVSVLISAIDPRGVFTEVLRGWTRRQDADASCYEVIVSGHVADDDGATLTTYLRAADRQVAPDEEDAASQWRRAAEVATGDLLVFTESHCLPAPGCIRELLARYDETGADVLAMSSPGTTGPDLSWIDQRFVEAEMAERPLAFQAVNPRAFAVSRKAYDRAGGIPGGTAAFGNFALAAGLMRVGARVAAAPRAAVLHRNIASTDKPGFCVAQYVEGQFSWYEQVPEPSAWALAGVHPRWACRGDFDPDHRTAAHAAVAAVRASAMPGSRTWRWARRGQRSLAWQEHLPDGPDEAALRSRAGEMESRLATLPRNGEGLEAWRAYWGTLTELEEAHAIQMFDTGQSGAASIASGILGSDRLFGLSLPRRVGGRWMRTIRGVGGARLCGLLDPVARISVEVVPGPESGPLGIVWSGDLIGRLEIGECTGRWDVPALESPDLAQILALVDLRHPIPKWGRPSRPHRDVALLRLVLEGKTGAHAFDVSAPVVELPDFTLIDDPASEERR